MKKKECENDNKPCYYLWRFMIDKGLREEAMEKLQWQRY